MIDLLKRAFDTLPIPSRLQTVINLPNTISIVRLGIIPVLFCLLLSPDQTWSLIMAILFVAAALTDMLDGYVARRYGIVTTMGKFLDPIVDKLVINTAMVLMIPIGRIPAWVVAIIVIRDFTVDGIRTIATSDGIVIAASPWGKKKTFCQVFAVFFLLVHYPFLGADAHVVGTWLMYLALALSIYSGMDYVWRFFRHILVEERGQRPDAAE